MDGLRGIAAVAVMEFHFSVFFLPQAGLFKFPYLNHAYLSVDLFFLLSGFVMAHVYGQALASNWRAHWLDFAIARFARLYPVFAVTTLVMVVAVALSHMPLQFVSLSRSTLALQPLLLQQWASHLGWNYPSWSISTEAEAYVYFVFFAGLLMTVRNPRLIAVCCVVVLIALSVSNGDAQLLRWRPGASPYAFRVHPRGTSFPHQREQSWTATQVDGAVGVLLFACAVVLKLDFLIVGAFACLIYYCVNVTDAPTARFLNSRPLVALGNWSYSIYLWHAPAHYVVMAGFALSRHPVSDLSPSSARLLILITTMAVVGLSAINYRYFEMPIRRLILNFNQRVTRIATSGRPPPALS